MSNMEYVTDIEIAATINTNKSTTKVAFDNYNEAVEWLWEKLSDEQRLSFRNSCCSGCGTLDTSCQCWNDD